MYLNRNFGIWKLTKINVMVFILLESILDEFYSSSIYTMPTMASVPSYC